MIHEVNHSKRILLLYSYLVFLQISSAEESLSLDVGSRRMSDPMSGTRMRAPYTRQYQDRAGISNSRNKNESTIHKTIPGQGWDIKQQEQE